MGSVGSTDSQTLDHGMTASASRNGSSGPAKPVRLAGTARAPGNETGALDPVKRLTPTNLEVGVLPHDDCA